MIVSTENGGDTIVIRRDVNQFVQQIRIVAFSPKHMNVSIENQPGRTFETDHHASEIPFKAVSMNVHCAKLIEWFHHPEKVFNWLKMEKADIRATQYHHMIVVKQLSETQNPVIREMVHPQVIEQLQKTIKQNRMNAKKSEEECVFDKPIQYPVQPIESIT